jgi:hypothetical protein
MVQAITRCLIDSGSIVTKGFVLVNLNKNGDIARKNELGTNRKNS